MRLETTRACASFSKGTALQLPGAQKDHIYMRISQRGSKAQYRGDTRNHEGLYVYEVFLGKNYGGRC